MIDHTDYCVLDYETFSACDLKRAGGWEYSVHESTEILCAAFRIGTRKELPKAKTKLWVPGVNEESFGQLLGALRSKDIHLVAHNASFEQMITRNVLGPRYMRSKLAELQSIPIDRWHCTAAGARSIGIPGNLEGAGAAMNLRVQKDKEGHKLMLKLSKPKKPSKKDPSIRHLDPEDHARLAAYCIQDVDTEVELFLKLPPLHPKERKFWCLNQKMNFRGFHVDRELVKGALSLISMETTRLDQKVYQLTQGKLRSARQRDAVLKYVRKKGIQITDLRSGTVRDTLANTKREAFPKAYDLLEIRDLISRSSTAKYTSFEERSRSDGRARDNTIWFGAHTGRDAGSGLQPHNLFKTLLKQDDLEAGLQLIKARDRHAIEALFPKPMELYASALRSCIIAKPGHTLEVGDFATIEVRVLFWLANEKFGLKQIVDGRDLYIEMAAKIYAIDPVKLLKAYKSGDKSAAMKRQLGKQAVLGAGFGIGVGGEKFLMTANQYGLDISLEIAQKAVKAYRALYPRIPAFWTGVEQAAIAAVRNPSKRYRIGHLVWAMEGNRLTCQLPIGRKLSYYGARVTAKQTMYGMRPQLEYLGVLSPSKVFGRVHTWGGKLTENVVQGVARDVLYEKLHALEEQAVALPTLAVHDEIVGEREKSVKRTFVPFVNTMSVVPEWAPGLPIKVEGWSEDRYRK